MCEYDICNWPEPGLKRQLKLAPCWMANSSGSLTRWAAGVGEILMAESVKCKVKLVFSSRVPITLWEKITVCFFVATKHIVYIPHISVRCYLFRMQTWSNRRKEWSFVKSELHIACNQTLPNTIVKAYWMINRVWSPGDAVEEAKQQYGVAGQDQPQVELVLICGSG